MASRDGPWVGTIIAMSMSSRRPTREGVPEDLACTDMPGVVPGGATDNRRCKSD